MPIVHVVLKIHMPCKNFHVPCKNLYKPCKAYVYCWENKYMPWLKNHLSSRAHNHKSLCAVGQDLLAPSMRGRLNVEPCHTSLPSLCFHSYYKLCLLDTIYNNHQIINRYDLLWARNVLQLNQRNCSLFYLLIHVIQLRLPLPAEWQWSVKLSMPGARALAVMELASPTSNILT